MGFSWKRSKKMAFTKMALFGDKVFNLSDEVFVVEYPPGFSGTRILPPGTEVRLISGVGGSETPGHHGYKGYTTVCPEYEIFATFKGIETICLRKKG